MKKTALIILIPFFSFLHSYKLLSQEYLFISDITIIGNIKTEEATIIRELPFKRGDIIAALHLERTLQEGANNLRNTSLFNFVHVSYISSFTENTPKYMSITIIISLEERWYFWPIVSLTLEDRNLSNWIKNTEWGKITAETGVSIFNIGGKNQNLSAQVIFGFNRGFRFSYSNILLDKRGRHLLNVGFIRQYSRTENVSSDNNTPYMLKSDSLFLVSKYSSSLLYTFRQTIRLKHILELTYDYSKIDPELLFVNPDYWGNEKLFRSSLSAEYNFVLDKRDYIQYPIDGYYINLAIKGYSALSQKIHYGQIRGDLHYYNTISNRISYALRSQWGISSKNVKGYIFDRAIGYNDILMRGYEFYVADGQNYITMSPTLRYNFLPQTVYYLKFLPFLPKFNRIHIALYAKLFGDIGYVSHSYPSANNNLSNRLLFSSGVGIDMVTYYDITLSLDYSFNQLGDHGPFFSVKSPLR